MTTATRISIDAAKLSAQVADTQSAPLRQSDCKSPPIVAILPSGKVDIIDGYHRIAGMILAGETMIDCVTCDDDALLGDAANAERPEVQDAAITAIYAAVR